MDKDTLLVNALNALLDVYALGNIHAPYTRVNKAMMDAGVAHALYLRLSGLKDDLVTEDTVVWPVPGDSPIFVDMWIRDNRYINGSIRTSGLIVEFTDYDLWQLDYVDEVTDPSNYSQGVTIESVAPI